MLIGIDKRMTSELLNTLAQMGHGDEIVIADANFPAQSTARHCNVQNALPLAGLDAVAAADLITSLMPLDGFSDYAALRMEIDGEADQMGDVHDDVWSVLRPRLPAGGVLDSVPRQTFYSMARGAYAVVLTAETRPFGCFILRKGIVS